MVTSIPRTKPVVAPPAAPPDPRSRGRQFRHRAPVRAMHWINVVCMTLLLMSGLQIFNAHPALYWGRDSNFAAPWLAIAAESTPAGPRGITTLAGHRFDTDGVLGVSREGGDGASGDAARSERAFPAWSTVPGPQWLSMGRRWHFFFAWLFVINGLAYLLWSISSRHLERDLAPTRPELRGIGRSVVDHLLFRHPTGEAARRYNVLQKLAYLAVIFVLVPLLVLCGLAMSPRLDAVYGGWVDLLGGRQSARTLHFLAAFGLLLFTAVHVFEVIVGGPWNQLRSMVTGWYTLPRPKPHGRQEERR